MNSPNQIKNRNWDREELERILYEEEMKRMPFDRKDFEDAKAKKPRIIEVV